MLFRSRRIKPEYPKKESYQTDDEYYLACRSITYEVSHRDMDSQKEEGHKGKEYTIEGLRFRNPEKLPNYFLDNAPERLKNKEKDMRGLMEADMHHTPFVSSLEKDYINPLYKEYQEYVYEVVSVRNGLE